MKKLYALYDKDDNFIDCSYFISDLLPCPDTYYSVKSRKTKDGCISLRIGNVFEIDLTPQNDIFQEEDENFIEEECDFIFSEMEMAKRRNINLRTIQRERKQRMIKEELEKQKQIRDMAYDLYWKGYLFDLTTKSDCEDFAKVLYDEGYRQVGETINKGKDENFKEFCKRGAKL